MNIVTKVKERLKKEGINSVETSFIKPETDKKMEGLQIDVTNNCYMVLYTDDDWSEDEFYRYCHDKTSNYFKYLTDNTTYTANMIMQNSYLAVEKQDSFRDDDVLCRKHLNLDVLVYIEVEEDMSETLTLTAIKNAGLTEDAIWSAAYHNTKNSTFLEIPENKRPVPNTLRFESSYCCGSSGILIKNLLWNFCTERGVGYCFIIPESQMYTQVTAPSRLSNGQLMNPKKQARILLRELIKTELSEDAVDFFGDKPLDQVIYIYDKLLNHIGKCLVSG